MVSYTNYPLVLVCWILVLFGLVLLVFVLFILQLPSVSLVWLCFPGLECRVATLLNPFTGSLRDLFSLLLTFLWTLVSCSSCLPRLLWRKVLHDYLCG